MVPNSRLEFWVTSGYSPVFCCSWSLPRGRSEVWKWRISDHKEEKIENPRDALYLTDRSERSTTFSGRIWCVYKENGGTENEHWYSDIALVPSLSFPRRWVCSSTEWKQDWIGKICMIDSICQSVFYWLVQSWVSRTKNKDKRRHKEWALSDRFSDR